ncbi:MAG: ammonium transporter [Prosthecobacter sp.]|nr:ammonium transporter [Prosthecobacter sp.]MBE2284025.1 ammonium transporter [Prosthecobacter sp.]
MTALAAFSSLAFSLGELQAQDAAPPAPAAAAAPAAPAPAPAAAPAPAPAAPAEAPAEEAKGPSTELFTTNNLWMMLSAALVFIMHLGFACVESGLTQSKNTVNILFKNTLIPCIGLLTYALCGFNLMYPGFADGDSQFWFKFSGFGITTDAAGVTSSYNVGYTYWTDFLFQAMFAATAATIVSGAVAERVKLSTFMVFSIIFVAIAYPIAGSWKWGNGWLNRLETPFYDFAGSTLVHSVGGWGALAGILLLGPRLGKYTADGKIKPILGHSMPLATIGVFLLWLGWFGFNGGSVLSADPGLVSLTLVTTCLAAAAGGVAAALASVIFMKKPDLSMALNGILAGLVGITAGADQMAAASSIYIGAIAGVLVVLSVLFFDKIKIDDPVGAVSVHLVCGIWGTLAVGIFGAKAGMPQLMSQLKGVAAYGVFTFVFAFVLLLILKIVMGLRVSPEEESEGLDIGEHGNVAYPSFQANH